MNDPIIYGSNSLYCDAAGAGKLWEPCSKTNDCGAGLICHVPASEAKGYCSRAGGDGFPECKAIEEECGLQGDGSGMFYISSAVKGCERLVGPGQEADLLQPLEPALRRIRGLDTAIRSRYEATLERLLCLHSVLLRATQARR
jgi:hypothetical protein